MALRFISRSSDGDSTTRACPRLRSSLATPRSESPSSKIEHELARRYTADARQRIRHTAKPLLSDCRPTSLRIKSTGHDCVPHRPRWTGSTASTNAKIAVINWYTVGLDPMGENSDSITVTASLTERRADGNTAARFETDGSTLGELARGLWTLRPGFPPLFGTSLKK